LIPEDPILLDHDRDGHRGDTGHDPGGDPDDDQPDDETPNLAIALTLLAQSLQKPHSENTKVCKPDSFDRSDSKKLWSFVVQCQMKFNNCPNTFSSECAKVNYALSYLKGTALEWFEPTLLQIQYNGTFDPT
jgi:hypothetical protein